MNKNNFKRLAFTLSEVLITLGLLGVISAMTIPTLTYNYRSKLLETQFKNTYSDIKEISARIHSEYGDIGEYAKSLSIGTLAQNILQYVSGSNHYRSDLTPNSSNTDPNKNFSTQFNKFYQNISHTGAGIHRFGASKNNTRAVSCDNDGIWLDSKGRIWTFNHESRIVCVDINGGAAPNMYNVDIFAFIPMTSAQVAQWVYGDSADNASNYTSQFVLCDIDAISQNNASNNTTCTEPDKGNKVCNLNFCPFNYPLTNNAPTENWDGTARKNRLGKEVQPTDDYWKDYIQYK